MPEGPECRSTIDYLNKALQGKVITDWVFCGGKYPDKPPEGFQEFNDALPLTFTAVSCKGKFIYFTMTNPEDGKEYYILHSLMLTGRWLKKHDKYAKWFVETDDGKTLWFTDSRSFATLKFTTDKGVLDEKLEKLGPDIMRREFTLAKFEELVAKYSNRNITSFVMDQDIISGCGNYIKAEVLYYSNISPLRKMSTLSQREIELLYEGLRIIPRLSYNNWGMTIKSAVDEDMECHYGVNEFKLYGQKYAKRTKTADGRTTYWDPKKQK